MYCEEAEPFVFGHSVLELNRLFLSSLIFFHSHKKAFFFPLIFISGLRVELHWMEKCKCVKCSLST